MPERKCLLKLLNASLLVALVSLAVATRSGREKYAAFSSANAIGNEDVAFTSDSDATGYTTAAEEIRVQFLVGNAAHLREQGQYDQAAPLLAEALSLAERISKDDDVLVASTLNQIGMLDKYAGRFDEGEQAYQRALAIVEEAEKNNPTISLELLLADIYHNLGGLDHARERYAHGEPFARRSVEIRERLLGPDNPDTTADIAALAALLEGQGKYEEAEKLYLHVLAVFKRMYGLESYDVAVNLNNLAALYFAEGKISEAHKLYEDSLRIKETMLGPSHPDIAMTLNNLAVLEKQSGDLNAAREHYRRAIAIFESSFAPDHPKLMECRENYEKLQKSVAKREKRADL